MEKNGWRLTAGATAFFCLVYGIVHLQVTRLELTSDRRDRRGAMEWGTIAIPLDSLRGEAPVPWQQRLAVYPLVGLLIKAGLKPALAVTLFKTATLALWLLALDRYLALWFPSPARRLVGIGTAVLFALYAIPWYVYSADDYLFLAMAALFLRICLREGRRRWLLPVTLLGVLAKETFLTIFMVPFIGRSRARRPGGLWTALSLPVGVVVAGMVRWLLPGSGSEVAVKFPGNLLDPRLVTVLPVGILLGASLAWRRRSAIGEDVDRLLPWLGVYLALILVGGIPAEVRIWYPALLYALPLLVERLSSDQHR